MDIALIGFVAALAGFGLAAYFYALLRAEREKSTWTQESRENLKHAFRSLASDELESKSRQLKATARDELSVVVGPLKDELKKLDGYVRELEGKREGAYSSIGTQLNMLNGLQESLRQQTTTLAQALKAPTVRGRWGEIHLRRLVELAGLQQHVDFSEQESGQTGRPDMLIRLPHGGIVPVDAKVPLDAFLRAMESDDDGARRQGLVAHAQALRSRVRELAQRAYWDQFDVSPEVVVMFVPVEASLGAAFQHDRDLFEFAFQNKVLVSSPIVLFALLKSIAFGWQQQQVAENAALIAEQGKTLHERVLTFIDHLGGVGKALESGVRKYNEAVASLENRLLPAARRLKDLGVGTTDPEPPGRIELQARLPAGKVIEKETNEL